LEINLIYLVLTILIGLNILAKREITTEEGLKFAKEKGMQFFETSAKSGHNVEDVIMK
jgi:hypothetical protein